MGLICVVDELGVEASVMVRPICTAYIDHEMDKFHHRLVSCACMYLLVSVSSHPHLLLCCSP
jgi:DNA repair photolyase